jgi:ABC-2 type transport system permease protein
MNIFLHELKAYRKSTIIWTCALIAVAAIYLSIYPTIAKDAAGFKKMIEDYPEVVRKAMGLTVDSFTSLIGVYSFTFMYITLIGAIQAMFYGVSIISKEARGKTSDFLLSKPISRQTVMTAKILAAATSLAITNIIYFTFASIIASKVATENYSTKIFIMVTLTLFFIQLIFMSLGITIAVVMPKIKNVLSVTLGTVFGFFFISMFGSVIGDKLVRFITPFKYFDTAYIIKNSSYELGFCILGLGIIIITLTLSYFLYSKKDIHAV